MPKPQPLSSLQSPIPAPAEPPATYGATPATLCNTASSPLRPILPSGLTPATFCNTAPTPLPAIPPSDPAPIVSQRNEATKIQSKSTKTAPARQKRHFSTFLPQLFLTKRSQARQSKSVLNPETRTLNPQPQFPLTSPQSTISVALKVIEPRSYRLYSLTLLSAKSALLPPWCIQNPPVCHGQAMMLLSSPKSSGSASSWVCIAVPEGRG